MHAKIKNIKIDCEVFKRKGPRDAPPLYQEYDYVQRQKVFCREIGNPSPLSRSLRVFYKENGDVIDRRYAQDCRYLNSHSICFEPSTTVVPDVDNEHPCLITHITVEVPISSKSRLGLFHSTNHVSQSIILTGHLYEGGSS